MSAHDFDQGDCNLNSVLQYCSVHIIALCSETWCSRSGSPIHLAVAEELMAVWLHYMPAGGGAPVQKYIYVFEFYIYIYIFFITFIIIFPLMAVWLLRPSLPSGHFWPFWPFLTIFDHFWPFLTIFNIFFFEFWIFLFRIFSGRFDTSGSMVPRLVPEISSLDAICDGGAAGIGDSRS